MALLIELFGDQVLTMTLDEVKAKIKSLPPIQKERRSYLLHEWSTITGNPLTQDDFIEVDGL